MKKTTAKEVAALVDETRGNIAAIARRLGVDRATVWNRCKESPGLMAALEDAREAMLDTAESKLYEAVLKGRTAELLFYLKTKGKARGYVERQELSIADLSAVDEWLEDRLGQQ